MKNEQWKNDFFALYTSNNMYNIQSAIKLKNNNIPSKLYRYRDFDKNSKKYRKQEICEGKIYLNPPKKLNDPFDSGTLLLGSEPTDYIQSKEEYLKNFKAMISENDMQRVLTSDNWFEDLMGILNDLYSGIEKDAASIFRNIPLDCAKTTNHIIRDIIQDYVKISCFTETPTNLPMWAFYAKEHTGICLEYDTMYFKNTDKLLPVFYRDTLPDGASIIINGKLGEYLYLNLAAIQKLSDWSYEREWRLIYKTSDWYEKVGDASKDFLESGKLIDFVKPSRVLLGKSISNENELIIREWCKEYNIVVQKMVCTEHGLKPQ